MSLFQKLCETYDNQQNLVGVYEEGKVPLAPIAHRTVKSNVLLEFTITAEGKLTDITKIEKESFIMPVTIDSDMRTSSNAKAVPHPLCDKLLYFNPVNKEGYANFVKQLEEWCNSSFAVPKLGAVLAYVKKGDIIKDLEIYQVKYKEDMYIRWRVVGLGEDDTAECWKDVKLFESWQKYYDSIAKLSKFIDSGICTVTSETGTIQLKHTGIMGKSKIISDNHNYVKNKEEDVNFVYFGRFLDAKEACTIGYKSSQKFHNVLRWQINRGMKLIMDSGKMRRTFLCWNPKGRKIPSLNNPFIPVTTSRISPSDYADKLKKAILGYRNDLPKTDDVIVLCLDAVSKGRASVTYYNEIKASDFLDRIEHWYSTFCWNNWKDGVRSPSLRKIIEVAFGREEKSKNKEKNSSNEKKYELVINDRIVGDAFQELLNCVLMKQKLPYYIVQKIFVNASKPQSYHWSKKRNTVYDDDVLPTACAVMRKYLNDQSKKEEWSMELDKAKCERSYLFGQLLAIMEKVELDTYDKEEDREPNAIRMQSAYCERPYYYFGVIHGLLTPYFSKLKPGARKYYKDLIGEILKELSKYEKNVLNKHLEEAYLLGYYLQRNELYMAKDKKEEEE